MLEYSYCIILCPFTLRREGEETRANLKEMERDLERANSILSTAMWRFDILYRDFF